MRIARAVAVSAIAVSLVSAGCRTARRVPHRNEHLIARHAVLVKHPLVPIDESDEREGNFAETRRQRYVLPRAYPGVAIDPAKRRQAYAHLQAMRAALGTPHVPGGSGAPHAPSPPAPPAPPDADGCAWTSAGPTNINGRVTSISIDPNDRDRIFVTSVGGIWRSLDRARRWERVSDDFLAATFSSSAINPAAPAEVFAGGGDANYHGSDGGDGLGIWRSTAGGDPGTWTKVSPEALDGQVVYRLIVDPAPPNDVYAATSAGVYIGTRSGSAMTFALLGAFNAWTSDIAVDFSSTPRKVYAAVRLATPSFARGVWKWNGVAWNQRSSGVPTTNSRGMRIALAQSAPKTLYLKVDAFFELGNENNGRLQGIYKTTTGGEPPSPGADAWTALAGASVLDDSGGPGSYYSWYNNVIEVDPSNADVVYAGGRDLFRTTNGGGHWDVVSAGADPSFPFAIHGDQHAIAFDPVNPKLVYSGNDGGLDRTTDTALAPWRWEDVAHGMTVTEFYSMTSQQAGATILAGGTQDNGTEMTFGNRTWYNPRGGDDFDVAIDAANADTIYLNDNGVFHEITNPVPGTPGALHEVTPVGGPPLFPLVTDPDVAGGALAAGAPGCSPQQIFKTTDGVHWTSIATLPAGGRVTFLGIAPGSSFQRYYAGIVWSPPSKEACPDFSGTAFSSTVWRTTTGGAPWTTTATGVPAGWLTSIAIDPADGQHAYLTGSYGAIVTTTNGGAGWTPLTNTPPGYHADVVIDPTDANTVYLATDVGVLRGSTGADGVTSWTPFDEGMPDGLDVTDLAVNASTKMLTASSIGHASYRRDVTPGAKCAQRQLLVRDNTFDHGATPSSSGIADAEHPIADPARPDFYKPDDTVGGRVYWWDSTDIRIDVPAVDPPQNELANVDHVEFETCPIELPECPAGTLLDSQPRRGRSARGYVQVTNRGIQPLTAARVIALWTDATTAVPLLPESFWSTTFPAGGGACGPLDTSTGWNLVDSAAPCKTIPIINPALPEVVRFDWEVPLKAPEHACYLVVVESPDDPIADSVRKTNERAVWNLVPNHRQISQRNLHVVDAPELLETVEVPNPTPTPGIDLTFSAAALTGGLRVILPAAEGVVGEGLVRGRRDATDDELALARANNLDPTAIFEIGGQTATIHVPVPPGGRWRIALVGSAAGPARLGIVATKNGTILGGSTYLLRRHVAAGIPDLTERLH